MSNAVILSIIQTINQRLNTLEQKLAAVVDDKSLTERYRFMEIEEMHMEKEAKVDAALSFLDNYDDNRAYLDSVRTIIDYIEEKRRREL